MQGRNGTGLMGRRSMNGRSMEGCISDNARRTSGGIGRGMGNGLRSGMGFGYGCRCGVRQEFTGKNSIQNP